MTTGEPARPAFEKGTKSTMRFKRVTAGLALAAFLAGPAVSQVQPAPDQGGSAMNPAQAGAIPSMAEGMIGVVNDDLISSYDLRQRMLLLMATSGIQPTQENLPAIQQQALRAIIDEHLQAQELDRYEVEIPDADVDREFASVAAESNMSSAQFANALRGIGVAPETLREQLRVEIGWRILVNGRYGSRARVGPDQIEATLQRIAAAAQKPQYLVGEIILDPAVVGSVEQAMYGGDQLVQQMLQGAPFQAVARQFSNAPSALRGGDAGWLVSGEIPPEVERVLETMRPGQLSRPIQTETGVYIVLLREKRSGGVSTSVTLKQAALPVAADAPEAQVQAAIQRLSAIAPGLTCQNIEARAGENEGVVAGDLGETPVDQLADEFRVVVEGMQVGQISAPVRTSVGVHLLALCDRQLVGGDIPSREQIEDRLYGQQLTMLARRYLRDLRNSATIETK